jgi:hypothetical protein
MARLTKKARRAVRGGATVQGLVRNPPKGYIPCKAVKIVRNKGRIEVLAKR